MLYKVLIIYLLAYTFHNSLILFLFIKNQGKFIQNMISDFFSVSIFGLSIIIKQIKNYLHYLGLLYFLDYLVKIRKGFKK